MRQLGRLGQLTSEDGVSKMTTWRMVSEGRIDRALMNAVGRRMVAIDDPETATVACARVSSHDQKGVLDRQIARTPAWAGATTSRSTGTFVRLGRV